MINWSNKYMWMSESIFLKFRNQKIIIKRLLHWYDTIKALKLDESLVQMFNRGLIEVKPISIKYYFKFF